MPNLHLNTSLRSYPRNSVTSTILPPDEDEEELDNIVEAGDEDEDHLHDDADVEDSEDDEYLEDAWAGFRFSG